ncbi:hypothetical protein [Campylobacter sp.]|nr:hypothetical protein [Campylobacter sp.]MDU6827741.1 hypothetical protein [Campylobacter sp.]
MRKRAKRCEICSSKLDEQGNCPWSGCPASPKYQKGKKNETDEKTKAANS